MFLPCQSGLNVFLVKDCYVVDNEPRIDYTLVAVKKTFQEKKGLVTMACKNAPGLTIYELMELTGKARSTLLYWRDKHGLFEATELTKDNPNMWGKKYSLHAAKTVLTVAKLEAQGASFHKIKMAVEALEERGENLAGAALYSDGNGIYKVDNKGEVMEGLAQNPGQLESLEFVDLDAVEKKAVSFFKEHAETESEDEDSGGTEKVRRTA